MRLKPKYSIFQMENMKVKKGRTRLSMRVEDDSIREDMLVLDDD